VSDSVTPVLSFSQVLLLLLLVPSTYMSVFFVVKFEFETFFDRAEFVVRQVVEKYSNLV